MTTGLALPALAMLIAAATPASALGAERVAAPTGLASAACSASDPCDLATAVDGASSGDDIVLQSGDYGSTVAPLTTSIASSASDVAVHGSLGAPRPRIFFSTASPGGISGLELLGARPVVRDIEIHNLSTAAGAQALFVDGGDGAIGTVDRVVASTAGVSDPAGSIAAAIVASSAVTIRDTIAYATNPGAGATIGGEALRLQGHATSSAGTVRNCTLVAANGSSGFSLDVAGLNGAAANSVGLRNTIVMGGNGLSVLSMAGTMTVVADHDVISGEATLPGGAYVPDVTTVSTVAPVFADPAAGDFHQASTSTSTLDTGFSTAVGDAVTDLDGDLRSVGAAPDIGADELPARAAIAPAAVSDTAPDHAIVLATVSPGGGITTATLQFGTTSDYGDEATPVTVSPIAPAPVSFTLTGLTPGTVYHARVVASNQRGTVSSGDVILTTSATTASSAPAVAARPPQPGPMVAETGRAPGHAAVSVAGSTTIRVTAGVATVMLHNGTRVAQRGSLSGSGLVRATTFHIAPGRVARVRLRLTKAGRRAFAHAPHGRLRISLRLAAGGTTRRLLLRLRS